MVEKTEKSDKKESSKIQRYKPLWRTVEKPRTQDLYPGADKAGAQTEAGRELLNFDRDKLPERTYLNEKQIDLFAKQMTMLAALDADDPRPLPEVYMESVMRLNLSLKGRAQNIGMSIFQNAAEEQQLEDFGKG